LPSPHPLLSCRQPLDSGTSTFFFPSRFFIALRKNDSIPRLGSSEPSKARSPSRGRFFRHAWFAAFLSLEFFRDASPRPASLKHRFFWPRCSIPPLCPPFLPPPQSSPLAGETPPSSVVASEDHVGRVFPSLTTFVICFFASPSSSFRLEFQNQVTILFRCDGSSPDSWKPSFCAPVSLACFYFFSPFGQVLISFFPRVR